MTKLLLLILCLSACSTLKNFEDEKVVNKNETKVCGESFCSFLHHENENHTIHIESKNPEQKLPDDLKLKAECELHHNYNDKPVHLKRIERKSIELKLTAIVGGWLIGKKEMKDECDVHLYIESNGKKENHFFSKSNR